MNKRQAKTLAWQIIVDAVEASKAGGIEHEALVGAMEGLSDAEAAKVYLVLDEEIDVLKRRLERLEKGLER